jgi:hypothetical protein
MKNALFTLALLLISLGAFAQTAFTKATLDAILQDYQKNPHSFFERNCSPDFRYISTDGSFQYFQEILNASVNDKIVANEIQDQRIIQSGDVAVVSGIHVQERPTYTRRVAVTYTFQRQNGRWMFVASQQNNISMVSPDQK